MEDAFAELQQPESRVLIVITGLLPFTAALAGSETDLDLRRHDMHA